MAAGRRGGYRGNELRDRESEMKFMRKRCTSSGEGFDYYRDGDRDRKGSSRREIERSKERNYGEKVTIIREKDIVSTDLGINWSCERGVRVFDRTGDLSEKTSVLESQVENNEGLCIEDDIFSSSRKKRKCSSIVWDEKEKVVSNSSIIDPSETIVSQESSMELDQCCGLQSSLPKSGNLSGSVGSTVTENSSSHSDQLGNNDHEEGQLEEEEFVARNISASRWADTSPSPRDKVRRPEPGELTRERLEGIQTKSLQSVEGENYDGSVHQGEYSDHNLVSNDSVDVDEENTAGSVSINNAEMGSEGKSCISNFPKRNINMLLGCRSVHEFERLNKINEGTYGVVYRAKDKRTGEIVALKKVKMEKEREGFPLTSLREINILLSSNHPSIVDVKEVVMDGLDGIFMVMEYMEHDLKGLMDTMKRPFSQSEVKCLMLQLLEGVKCIHDNWVLHRDLKTSNILLNNQGELKICDFGLSRQYGSPLKPYTQLVVTLWYRAPELLLGAKQYSTAIDMWSLGCIMAELLAKEPLFNGKTEFDQLDKIFRILGTPSEKIWPGISKLPGFKANFVRHQYNQLREKFPPKSFTGSPVLSDAGFDLLSRLLTYDPEMRISAEDAVNHEWFHEAPLPKSKDFMPTFPAPHTQDRRRGRVLVSPDPLEEQRRRELRQGKLGTGGLFG